MNKLYVVLERTMRGDKIIKCIPGIRSFLYNCTGLLITVCLFYLRAVSINLDSATSHDYRTLSAKHAIEDWSYFLAQFWHVISFIKTRVQSIRIQMQLNYKPRFNHATKLLHRFQTNNFCRYNMTNAVVKGPHWAVTKLCNWSRNTLVLWIPSIYKCISSTPFMPLLFLSNLVAQLHLLILLRVLTIWVLHFSDEFLI